MSDSRPDLLNRIANKVAPPAPGPTATAASLGRALERLAGHDLGIKGQISIGAGRGDDMKSFLKLWPDSRVLLIEMDEAFRPAHAQLAEADPRFRSEICAAAGHDGAGSIAKNDSYGGALVAADADGARAVRTARLDTLAQEHGIEGPVFLKFDTHGAELEILSGATEVLSRTSLIMMECYNFKLNFTGGKNLTFDEMSLHMKSLGFRCVDMCDPLFRPRDQVLWQVHLFFLRDDHPVWSSNSYKG